jgi:hypothetical protein
MAREALVVPFFLKETNDELIARLKDFEALVRADEREACAKVIESWRKWGADVALLVKAIRTMSDPVCTTPPAAQRQWVGLTDEEVYPLANEHLHYQMEGYEVSGIYNLAQAIETKLKEKNT